MNAREVHVTPGLRQQIRSLISDAYYNARNEGLTMETAADRAASGVVALIEKAPLTPLVTEAAE